MSDVIITRRNAILGTAAGLAAAAAAPAAVSPAFAKAEFKGIDVPLHARFKLGEFEVTTLLAGQRTVPGDPQGTFAMNVDKAEFEKVTKQHFLPVDVAKFYFTPTVVNTGSELILFDAGLGGEAPGIIPALQSAGYSADQVDVVVVTHMHPDHIGGLMEDGKPAFPNARYVTGEVEYNFWTAPGRDSGATARVGKLANSNVKPLAPKMAFIKPGQDASPGITALNAFGHTPGHMGYHIESASSRLILIADACNHYVASMQRPDWQVKFDMDKGAAAETRKKLLDMAAADKVPVAGYHMPFPAVGFIERKDIGYRWSPVTYQFNL